VVGLGHRGLVGNTTAAESGEVLRAVIPVLQWTFFGGLRVDISVCNKILLYNTAFYRQQNGVCELTDANLKWYSLFALSL